MLLLFVCFTAVHSCLFDTTLSFHNKSEFCLGSSKTYASTEESRPNVEACRNRNIVIFLPLQTPAIGMQSCFTFLYKKSVVVQIKFNYHYVIILLFFIYHCFRDILYL